MTPFSFLVNVLLAPAGKHQAGDHRGGIAAMGILALLVLGFGLFPTLTIPLLDNIVIPLAGASAGAALVPPFFTIQPGGAEIPPRFVNDFHDLGAQVGRGFLPGAGMVVLRRGGTTNPVVFAMSTFYMFFVLIFLLTITYFVTRLCTRRRAAARGEVWDGGIRRLLPSMTYTATGFSNPVRVVFQAIVNPTTEEEPPAFRHFVICRPAQGFLSCKRRNKRGLQAMAGKFRKITTAHKEDKMELGMIGLGRMGANMVRRLLQGKHRVVAYNRTAEKTKEIVGEGAIGAFSLDELVEKLATPRIIWLMVPSGKPTDDMIQELSLKLSKGDILIDGGNSHYTDTVRRSEMLKGKGIELIDAGTSGGVWGLKEGYCLMIGGSDAAFKKCEPLFKTLAPPDGYTHMGPVGSGHYVKMVHNGIEYGMLQAYGEGFEVLQAGPYKLDLHAIAKLWNHASVVRSWLLELAEAAFQKDPTLADIKGYVEDTGEGRWTVQEAIERNVPTPVITLSLLARFRSRQPDSFSAKVVAALRNEFGGHAVVAAKS